MTTQCCRQNRSTRPEMKTYFYDPLNTVEIEFIAVIIDAGKD